MPLESILDKSKADNIAKTLTCIQAFWIIIQSIARVASGLPLTFLEINTLGHVKCAQFMFLFWWDKPLEILYPTLLSCDTMHDLCALMWSSTQWRNVEPQHAEEIQRQMEERLRLRRCLAAASRIGLPQVLRPFSTSGLSGGSR